MEGLPSKSKGSHDEVLSNEGKATNALECAVCLQNCIHPARLPCNHVFCYLCVKGVANQSKRCPMCRQEIPEDFIEHPQLIDHQQTDAIPVDTDDQEFQWFYEGRNGWWQYDQRTNIELETAFKQGKQSCELFIAGFLYIADFTTMFQFRRNDHSRRRRIKRDLCNAPKKGVAGLRLKETDTEPHNSRNEPKASTSTEQGQKIDESESSSSSSSSSSNEIEDQELVIVHDGEIQSNPAAVLPENVSTRNVASADHGANSLHQVLEQMRSVVISGNFSCTTGQNFNDNGSVILDYPSSSGFNRTSSGTIDSSDEEPT